MTDRKDRALGFILWPVIAVLILLAILQGCATVAKADAAFLGTPPEPLEPGKHFVMTDTRAGAMLRCAKILGFPVSTCTYRRAGDSTATVIIAIDEIGPVYRHELYHVQQDARGEPMNHKGWQ